MIKRIEVFWDVLQAKCGRVSGWGLVMLSLGAAYIICLIIKDFSRIDNDAPIVFLMAVVVVSRLTPKYRYGIVTSLAASFSINFFFTYPYNVFTLLIAGYPVDFVCMTVVSLMISAMTTHEREAAKLALMHEQETIRLYRQNKNLEEKRAKAKLDAEKEKMYGNLLRSVSHDLRTPLTSVAGTSSVLMQSDDALTSEERVSLATDIHNEALWLTQMVENLLSVTRVNNGGEVKLNERLEIVDEVLEEGVSKFKRRFPDQAVCVTPPDDVVLVNMDAMLIEQVLINLLENAVRHSGVSDVIDVSAQIQENFVSFSVRDHGVGLSADDIPRIFSGMLNTDDSTRGMGIGLSVCKSIIDAHGGTVTAGNHPYGGAEFIFSLPLDADNK